MKNSEKNMEIEMKNMRLGVEWRRKEKKTSDSHVGLCIKNPDAFPSHVSLDSPLESPSFLSILLSVFISLYSVVALFIEGSRAGIHEPKAAEEERERKRERWTHTDIQLGEGLGWVAMVYSL